MEAIKHSDTTSTLRSKRAGKHRACVQCTRGSGNQCYLYKKPKGSRETTSTCEQQIITKPG